MMHQHFTIVGIGEALFDIFPDGQRLGGAPLNLVVHAQQLSQPRHGQAVLVSRVGQDEPGELLTRQLQERGVDTRYIQTDPDRPTGRVYVELDGQGQPRYEIVKNVAWDVIQFDFDLEDLAMNCSAVAFGSLAQRDGQSRNTIFRFLDLARQATRLFDVNLRQGAYTARELRRSCEAATIVKLNEQELSELAAMLGLAPLEDAADEQAGHAQALRRHYELEMVVLTRGAQGTSVFTGEGRVDGERVSYPPEEGADAVGAGDAAAAAILVSKALRFPPQRLADLANHLGAYVASQPGATPELPEAMLELVK